MSAEWIIPKSLDGEVKIRLLKNRFDGMPVYHMKEGSLSFDTELDCPWCDAEEEAKNNHFPKDLFEV
jgi:hypothetical protein